MYSVSHLQIAMPTWHKLRLWIATDPDASLPLYASAFPRKNHGYDPPQQYSCILILQLITTMFGSMSSTFTTADDLLLFLNVINGTLLLHCEDSAMLRLCLGTLLNASRHFKQVFSTSG